MTKTQIRSNSLLAIVVLAILALISSSATAAPQEGVFKRSGEEISNSTKEAKTENAEQPTATNTTTKSITKESAAKIDQQSDGWYTIVDDASLVEVRMPGKPTYKEITFSPIAGRPAVVNHLYNTLVNKEISVDYSWMDLHEAPAGRKLTEALDGAVKGAVVNVFGQLDGMTKIRSGKIPGREFEFTFPIQTPDGKTHMITGKSRIFIKDNRQFQLNVISPKGKDNQEMITKLFDSLTIKM